MITATRKSGGFAARWRRCTTLAAAAVLATSAAAAYTGSAAFGSVRSGIAWTSCKGLGKKFECARVAVPFDWSRPDGKNIELAVMRHLASRPDKRIGSMFLNPGGPGQSGVDLVRNSSDDFDQWGGGHFDLVGWDPRGTNDSTHVKCFSSSADQDQFWKGVSMPDTRAASVAYQRKTVALASMCGKLSGELLSHISTGDTARDLDRLRELVGDQKITYVGLSYGSMIGETYVNLFPVACARSCWTASSMRSTKPPAWRRISATPSRPPTRSSGSSSHCAKKRVQSAARSPVTARRSRSAWQHSSPRLAARRSRRPTRIPPRPTQLR